MTHVANTPRPPRPKPLWESWPQPQMTISPNPWPNLYVPQGPKGR